MGLEKGTAASVYARMERDRRPFLERAWDVACLTIPHLLPKEDHSPGTSDLPTPYQADGARGVNSLAAKLLLSLFPPNQPFFNLSVDTFAAEALAGSPEIVTELDESLVRIVQATSKEVEGRGFRPPLYETFRHLVVTGNALLHIPDSGKAKMFRLDQYGIERDPEGNVLTIIIKERVAPKILSARFQEQARQAEEDMSADMGTTAVSATLTVSDDGLGGEEPVVVYTVIHRDSRDNGPDKFVAYQEFKNTEVPGSRGIWNEDEMPYIPLRLTHISNENYGRGIGEEQLGDLVSLEGLSQSIVEGSIEAARVVNLLRPGATAAAEDLERAENGDYITGDPDDVHTLRQEKFNDFRVALETKGSLQRGLSQAFLSASTVRRDAERVTAEEIRAIIQELEETLGGVYSSLASELQLPLVKRIMSIMRKEQRLPKLPPQIRMSIVTGVEAVGRGQDLDRLLRYFAAAQQAMGPEVFQLYHQPRDIYAKLAAATSVDTTGMVRSEEEVAQMRQQQQAQELAQSPAGAAAVREVGRANQPPDQAQPQQ